MSTRPLVRIVKGSLVIRLSSRVLAFATENHPEFWDAENDKNRVKVTDREQWTEAVRDALLVEEEEEDGSTFLTRALDKAIAHAVEQGEEGIEFLDEPTAK